jgi:putative peptidoglycan lipid II flippase
MSHKTLIALWALAGLSSLLAYLRDAAVAATFGAGQITDALFVGTFVPTLLQVVLVAGSLAPALLPVFTGQMDQAGADHAWRLLANLSRRAAAAVLLLCLAGELLAPWLVRLVAPGFDAETSALAAQLLRLSLPALLFLTPAGIAGVVLNYRRNFVVPACGAAAFNATVLAGAWAAGRLGIGMVAGAMVAGAALQLVIQVAALEAAERRALLWLTPGSAPVAERQVARLAGPLLVFMLLAQSVPLLERFIASSLAPGELSRLAFAGKLSALLSTTIAASLVTMVFPALAQDALQADPDAFTARLLRSLRQTTLIMLPLSIWLFVCAPLVVSLAFERGSFTGADAQATAQLLQLLALGIVPGALGVLLTRAYHALQDTRMPLVIGMLNTAIYLGLGIVLTGAWQTSGLAAAYVVSTYTGLVLLLAGLARRRIITPARLTGGGVVPGLLAAAASGLAAWALGVWLGALWPANTPMVRAAVLVLMGVTGVAGYSAGCLALGVVAWRGWHGLSLIEND